MIGTSIIMEPGVFIFDNELISQNPRYRIAIIPRNPVPYLTLFPSACQLGIDTPFFVFVHTILFSNFEDVADSELYGIIGFFIKDDNTLYLVDLVDVYRLERVNHIIDYPAALNVAP